MNDRKPRDGREEGADTNEVPQFPMRINKFLAMEGGGSRRDMDKLVAAGKVLINGKVALLGTKVNEGDKVETRFHGTKDKQRNNEKAMERRSRANRGRK